MDLPDLHLIPLVDLALDLRHWRSSEEVPSPASTAKGRSLEVVFVKILGVVVVMEVVMRGVIVVMDGWMDGWRDGWMS